MGVEGSSKKRKREAHVAEALDGESNSKKAKLVANKVGDGVEVPVVSGRQKRTKKKMTENQEAKMQTERKRKTEGKSESPTKAAGKKKKAPIAASKPAPKSKKKISANHGANGSDSNDHILEGAKSEVTSEESPGGRRRRFLSSESSSIKKELQVRVDRDKKCLVVKNLDADTAESDLRGASAGLLEVRIQVQKSKKAGGRKLAFLEFKDQDTCKENLVSVTKFVTKLQPKATVELGEKMEKTLPKKNLVFDTQSLFIRGLEPGTLKSEIEALFPTCNSIEGDFEGEEDDERLMKDSFIVEFSSVEECSRIKNSTLKFKGRDVGMEFAMANRRQTTRALKKSKLHSTRESLKKKKEQKKQNGKKSVAPAKSANQSPETEKTDSSSPAKQKGKPREPQKQSPSPPSKIKPPAGVSANGENKVNTRAIKRGVAQKSKQKNPKVGEEELVGEKIPKPSARNTAVREKKPAKQKNVSQLNKSKSPKEKPDQQKGRRTRVANQ